MRIGALIAGTLLFLLGVGLVMGGGTMKAVGDACVDIRCDDSDVVMMGAFGEGLFGAGFLVGGGGIALLVAGVLARPKTAPALSEAEGPSSSS